MKNLINPLILIAMVSLVVAVLSKLIPSLSSWLCSIVPVGTLRPNAFLRLTNSLLLLAVALAVVQLLKAKKA